MAVTHGRSAYFNLDNSSGSPTDLSTYTKEVKLDLDIQIHDVTTFGATARAKTTGLKDGKFTVTFVNDPTLQTHLTSVWAAASTSLTFVFGPQGSTTGQRRFAGECLIPQLPIEAKVDDIETITVTFECTGAVTIDTF